MAGGAAQVEVTTKPGRKIKKSETIPGPGNPANKRSKGWKHSPKTGFPQTMINRETTSLEFRVTEAISEGIYNEHVWLLKA